MEEFSAGVFYNGDLRLTEMVLEDTMIVWHQWQPPGMPEGHVVDLGYNEAGDLVGIKIWDDVRKPVST
jgi:hypothetical protein